MNARILQLFIRAITFGLMYLAGRLGVQWTDDQVHTIVEPLAAGGAALSMFILDLLMHRYNVDKGVAAKLKAKLIFQ